MSAQPAYNYADSAFERERYAQPSISVVPGRGREQSPSLSPSAVFVAKVAAILLVAFALLGVVRVTLNSAAVSAAVESQQLSGQIEEARTEGNQLEVTQSALSNPTRVKETASAMGMAAPAETAMIDVSGDVVVTDEVGNLSLSGSVSAAAQG